MYLAGNTTLEQDHASFIDVLEGLEYLQADLVIGQQL